jgi:hypothetical protein
MPKICYKYFYFNILAVLQNWKFLMYILNISTWSILEYVLIETVIVEYSIVRKVPGSYRSYGQSFIAGRNRGFSHNNLVWTSSRVHAAFCSLDSFWSLRETRVSWVWSWILIIIQYQAFDYMDLSLPHGPYTFPLHPFRRPICPSAHSSVYMKRLENG